MRHKVKQSKFAVMPVYRPRYTLNITLHSIFLLTLNCHLIHAFSILSSILDSTSKTQDLILPCQLRSTLPNLRSRSNVQFSCKCLLLLLITVFTLWLTILLICSGDIHPNPGPSSIPSSLNSSTSHNHSNNSLRSPNLSHNLSFVHYNVQSILNKLDILEAELFEFDILAFTETWLNPTVQSDDLVFQTFHKPERKDRRSDHFGGLLLYVKSGIFYKRRSDLEINGIECIWIEVVLNKKSLLFGLFYRPPNSSADVYSNIEESISLELSHELSSPLCSLFNKSLSLGKFPSPYKDANVTPVHKKGDLSLVSNYRPISLLNSVAKLFEKLVFKYLYNHLQDNNMLSSLQSGFIPGDSTVNQLVYLYHIFTEALDAGKEVRTVFCDISKAFDRVWHEGLIYKLKAAGVSGDVLRWFQSYLSGRRQRVVLPGSLSEWVYIKAGVPQGSILGPLLFLLYINDIVKNIGSNIRLFADDTSLFIIVDNPTTAALCLNSDLEKLSRWAAIWLVTFNPSKNESLLISRKINKPIHPPLYMQNVQIQEVSSHKHLGLYFSNDCSWHQHIDYIKQKAWFRIHIMRKLKFNLDRKSLETIYLTFIRPLLEYGDVIWDNCTQYEKNELDKIQNEAARITTGTTKLVSLDNLYKEVGWQTLHRRRQDHKITLFYKMFNQLTPVYLSSLIPQQVNAISHHNLRNSNDIHTIRSNTSLYHNSFLPSTLRQWNSLPVEVRQLNTLSSFKTFLKKDLQSVPTYYYCGSRKAQILHARLRTGCSSLNMDLLHKNITESPLCRCGSIEDTQHYFFHCRFYQGPRNTLLNACTTYQNPSLSLLLFGSSTLSLEANIAILEHVHKYILDTKRFT